ncbi:ABC transporter ATP-binding protein [Paenibacillus sp. FSL R7-0333]|uniref:ABC transporter ATP-binding protein n=1 Tax=Paenibacillus sp. FSL R7-0333 TaxID=1926587 RepID=UPI00096BFF60|nr:peptide ABC transporter ATP-binding protein [Paenibacillus sp. FSL R7-0333]
MPLQAEALSKIYGTESNKVTALNNVSITIEDGQFVSIIGPSGSGKSTLLHLLSGIDKPTGGTVLFNNEDMYALGEKELSAFRRQKFGFVFQQFHLIPILTAEENICMPVLLDRKQPDQEYLRELTDFLEISGRLSHLPHELSGGQQQRVAVARALIAKPQIIFADEPTGNLDSKSSKEVIELLTRASKQFGATLIMITHDLAISQLSERRLTISDGVLSEVESQ